MRNREKLLFLVLNIVKHIFLAVLYFLAAGSRKAAQMHSDPVNSFHVGNSGKKSNLLLLLHPSLLSHRVDSQPFINQIQSMFSAVESV